MKRYIPYLSMIVLFLIAACGSSSSKQSDYPSPNLTPIAKEPIVNEPFELSPRFTLKEGDFNFTLFSRQEMYEANEEPEIFAELTYAGKKEMIEIVHSDPLIAFSLHELTRNVKLDMVLREIAITNTLTQNEPVLIKFDIKNSPMYANDETSRQFYDEAKQNGLPPGDYVIKSRAQFFVKDDQDYNLEAVIQFSIKK